MFDVKFAAGIRDVKLKVKSKDGVETRKVVIAFEREFDDLIAAGMGGDARAGLAALRSGGMASCVLPLDAVRATADLTAGLGETIALAGLKGIKATGNAPTEDGFPPSIRLEFEFSFAPRPWAFFGEYSGQSCIIELTKQQLELAGTRPVSAAGVVVGEDLTDMSPEAAADHIIGKVGRGKKNAS